MANNINFPFGKLIAKMFVSTRLLVSICITCLFLFTFCNRGKQQTALFSLVTNTGIDFENNVKDGQKDNSFLFRNFYNGGGVAIGDINNDSLPDIFFTSNMGDNKLYLNKGNFKFEDITAKSG